MATKIAATSHFLCATCQQSVNPLGKFDAAREAADTCCRCGSITTSGAVLDAAADTLPCHGQTGRHGGKATTDVPASATVKH